MQIYFTRINFPLHIYNLLVQKIHFKYMYSTLSTYRLCIQFSINTRYSVIVLEPKVIYTHI